MTKFLAKLMRMTRTQIQIGEVAGSHFRGLADLQIAFHATCGDRRGYMLRRRRLVDRAAYNYDPTLGWETDIWFEWLDENE